VPPTGYSVPFLPQPGFDPLISPDAAGWWRRSTAIVKAGWRQLAAIQAIGAALQFAVELPLHLYLTTPHDRVSPAAGAASDLSGLFAAFGLVLVASFVATVIGAVVAIATMQIGVTIAAGGQPRLVPALRAAARRTFPLLGWQLAAELVVLIGVCACVLPAIYVLAVFTILPAVVTFERTNAISRCFRLFNGSLGLAVGRIAAVIGIGIGAGIAGSTLVNGIGAAGASTGFAPTASLAATVVAQLIGAVVARGAAVLTGPLTLTAYADLRARIEPLTTADLLAELGTPATT
jgi:hypothetical protein